MDCVDGILRKLNSCPLDGYVIYHPVTWGASEKKTSHNLASCLSSDFAKAGQSLKDLFVPGVALQDRNAKTAPSHGSLRLEVLTASSETLNIHRPLLGPRVATADAPTKGGKGGLQKKQSLASKSESGHGRSTCHSKETKRGPISPDMFVTVTKIREQEQQQQANLSAGLCRPAAQMHLQKNTTQDADKNPTPQLRMTGVLINTQHGRKRNPY